MIIEAAFTAVVTSLVRTIITHRVVMTMLMIAGGMRDMRMPMSVVPVMGVRPVAVMRVAGIRMQMIAGMRMARMAVRQLRTCQQQMSRESRKDGQVSCTNTHKMENS